jgi:hypothetical protein
MPEIFVTAGHEGRDGDAVMLRERVSAADFESERFAVNLVERLGWAVDDATEAERVVPEEPARGRITGREKPRRRTSKAGKPAKAERESPLEPVGSA